MTLLNVRKEEFTIHQQIMGLLSISRIAAGMKYQIGPDFHRSQWVVHLDSALDTIEVRIDEGRSIGLEMVTQETLPINKRITIINDKTEDPVSGTWMMMYNFHEQTKTLFYWQTKMLVINYDMKPYRKAIQ